MTDQKLEPGSTYRVEAEFTVKDHVGLGVVVEDTKGRLWAPRSYDKIEKVRDRFKKGAYYLDPEIGRVYRRTGFDPVNTQNPKWDEVGRSYVRDPDVVDEAKLVRIHREDERE